MEEKIVGEKKGSSLFSDISFTLLSIASLSSVFIYTAPALDLQPNSGSPTIPRFLGPCRTENGLTNVPCHLNNSLNKKP